MGEKGPPVTRERMRPKLDPNSETDRLQIVAPRSWIGRLSEWRRQQDPIPSVSAAIRTLVDMGLEAYERGLLEPKRDKPSGKPSDKPDA